jgi:3-phosphoshikimate 1-carboxyvinyltransferase
VSGGVPGAAHDVMRVPVAAGPVDAVVDVPGSKSIANRALVCAALARGESRLVGVPAGDDTSALLAALPALGVAVHDDGTVVTVQGCDGRPDGRRAVLQSRLAGTTSRFLTAVAALGTVPIVIDGDPPLRRRPMAPLHDALAQLGARVRQLGEPGRLPVEVTGPLHGGAVSLPGDVSSQYVTALMLIGPYVAGGLRTHLTSALVSGPYVDITAAVMTAFGAVGIDVGELDVTVPAGGYTATAYAVEPDASSASYPLAVAAVAGGTVRVNALGPTALQGDARFADLLALMGCEVRRDDAGTTVSRRPGTVLRGIDVDLGDASDLVPTVAAVAVTASTRTTIRGVGFIRAKESDRIGDLVGELVRTGAGAFETDDGLVIEPAPAGLHGTRLGTHHDHRLAMAFGVLGTAVAGIEVEDPLVVSKSWPGYWEALARILGAPATSTS